MTLILFSIYWGSCGFCTLFVVSEAKRVGWLDAFTAIVFGGFIVPAAIFKQAVMK
jgi:hypothetical protein